MIRKTLVLLILCLCANLMAQTYPKKANVIRLLTYNTHYCKGGSDPGSISDFNTNRLALVIKKLDADIVSLQELDSAASSRGKRYLLGDIAKATGLSYTPVYGKATSYDGGSIGCGTLIKNSNRINKIKKIPLPGDEPRIVVRTDLDKFVFMSTHFDLNDAKRNEGAYTIVSELDYIRKPVFLVGDLNDSHRWSTGVFTTLLDKFALCSDVDGNTIPGRKEDGQACIDYILFRNYNNSGITLTETHIVRNLEINGSIVDLKDISDHYPVFVDIEVPGTAGIEDAQEIKLHIYPNLESNVLNIEGEATCSQITIYSTIGQKQIEKRGDDIKSLDISNLSKGIYVVEAYSKNKYYQTKIVKQ